MDNSSKIEQVCSAVEKKIKYIFKDKSILIEALTHSSFANENKMSGNHNERLEYLGDAVLELVSSEYIFKNHPELPEGKMSKLRASIVCEPTLAICARAIELDKNILLGRGEILLEGNKRDSIVSDAFEALIGAIYLDGGFEFAKAFIEEYLLSNVGDIRLFVDNKTRLQEIVQDMNKTLVYELEKSEGPDHDKRFFVNVSVDGEVLGRGIGRSKKIAQQEAAAEAIKKLER